MTTGKPDFNTSANPLLGMALAFLGASCFSFSDMTAKWLSQSYSVVQILFMYSLSATLSYLILSRFMRGSVKASFRPHHPLLLTIRTVCVIAVGYLNVYAFSQMPLSNAYALLFTGPILSCLLSGPMLGESVRPKEWLLAGIGFTGVLVILRPGLIGLSLASLSALAGAVCVASMNNLSRKMSDKDTSFTIAFIPVLSSIPVNCLIMVLTISFIVPTMFHFVLFAFGGSVVALGFFLLARAYSLARIAIVAPMAYSQMIWSIILDYTLYGTEPDAMVLLGAAIIILCGILLMRSRQTKTVLP